MKALFNTFRRHTRILTISIVFVSLFPLVAQAKPPKCKGPVTERPIEDFLGAQGTTNIFFFPVPDLAASTGGPPSSDEIINFAVVDYAGLAAKWIENNSVVQLGTDPRGQVKQRDCDDGSVEITVKLSTKNALGFAQSIEDLTNNGFDFLCTVPIFGARAQDVAGLDTGDPDPCGNIPPDGVPVPPALGSATLDVTFRIYCEQESCEPEPALPDLRKVVQCPTPEPLPEGFCGPDNLDDYRPVTFSFHSTTFEKKDAFGKNRVLRVFQLGFAPRIGDDIFAVFEYKKEVVDIGP